MQSLMVDLFNKFILFPTFMIEIFDEVVNGIVKNSDLFKQHVSPDYEIKIKTFPSRMPDSHKTKIRNINVRNIGNLVCIKGLVLRVSEVVPIMTMGVFECHVCKEHISSVLVDGVITEPKYCDKCRNQNS
mmetsp:Transcript_4509/g.9176  ORF Transcript_4509/g.9176 Transcript_4509/m.9176 type:complete len:130 (+) Transcript_4509:384-773(+)